MMSLVIGLAMFALLAPIAHSVRASAEVVDAQTFLEQYAGGTIPAGATIKIQDGTHGAFNGDFTADLKGKIEIGANVVMDVTGRFRLNGRL
jgi:hypothetical protein